jgi:type II secretory pathway component PulC
MRGIVAFGLAVCFLMGTAATGEGSSDSPAVSTGSRALEAHKLIGITYGTPRDTNAVFENHQSKEQKAYRIGDRIEGATIIKIERQKVLLNRDGQTITVYLSKGSPGKEKTKDGIPIPEADPQQARQQVISSVIPPYDPRVEDRTRSITRDQLKHFSEQINSQEKAGPVFVKTPVGTTLSLARIDSNVLAGLGLESSDLIVEISGMGIDSWTRLHQTLGILDRAKVLNISVLRGSVVKPLYYSVQ